MPARQSEALVLRTYPFGEADLVVSFLTRDLGRLRGVAKRARRAKSPFGSGLERLSHVRVLFHQRETRELVTLVSCELIQSQFGLLKSYEAGVVLDYMAEVSEQLLPAGEKNERFFRLLLTVLEHLRAEPEQGLWAAVAYFSLWAVRLSGFLPQLQVSESARQIADEMLRTPLGQLTAREWNKQTCADLRRFLVRTVEQQIERKLASVPILESL